MTAKELYEKETGIKCPTHQLAYYEWRINYVAWLEKKVESVFIPKPIDPNVEGCTGSVGVSDPGLINGVIITDDPLWYKPNGDFKTMIEIQETIAKRKQSGSKD